MFLSLLLVDTGVNPDRPRPGRLWLRNTYHVHQRLCMAFPSAACKKEDPEFLKPFDPRHFPYAQTGEIRVVENKGTTIEKEGHVHAERSTEAGFLFRVDPLAGGRAIIVVQSAVQPDWDYAFQNTSFLIGTDMKQFDPSFAVGQSLRFRLMANPTKRLRQDSVGPDGNPIRDAWVGKRVAVPPDQLKEWLTRQGSHGGFTIDAGHTSVQTGYAGASKGNSTSDEDGGTGGKQKRLFYARYDGVLRVTDPDALARTIVSGIGSGKAFGFGLLSVAPVRGPA